MVEIWEAAAQRIKAMRRNGSRWRPSLVAPALADVAEEVGVVAELALVLRKGLELQYRARP